jgi:hypothetical protein
MSLTDARQVAAPAVLIALGTLPRLTLGWLLCTGGLRILAMPPTGGGRSGQLRQKLSRIGCRVIATERLHPLGLRLPRQVSRPEENPSPTALARKDSLSMQPSQMIRAVS